MKKILSYFSLLFIMMFASCSNEDVALDKTQHNFTVQGQPHDLSKSKISRVKSATVDDSKGGDVNFTMDDIKFWVGTGSQKAALVIEWHDGKTPDALVWGYKWDGEKYGIDMIRDIVQADPRLTFLTHMTGPMGYTIGGLGYHIDKSGNQYLIYNNDTKNPIYPEKGIVSTDKYNYDKWTYSDTKDHWCAGWYNGYWSYWVKDNRTDAWEYSNWGASSRKLVNGSWDGWSFLDDMSQMEGNQLGTKFTAALPN